MRTLSRELRKALENIVTEARDAGEEAAGKAMKALAVADREAHRSMSPEQKSLRNRLRAHGRQLGDLRNAEGGMQRLDHLVAECAYEHWHRMLFARFLAENQLLLEPESGVAIAVEEVKELARARGQDWVVLAGEFAVRMLPQVFRQDNPVLQVQLAPEDRKRLEELLESLPGEVFTASDSLGWTYQFWQAERKDAINAAGIKIGADELPAVTQLFTEDYIVDFLLDNTLGAWHAGKIFAVNSQLAEKAKSEEELRKAVALPGYHWKYLRFMQGKDGAWTPAAGTFDGWPKTAKDLKCLDPCMGSGHFVVAMFERLVAVRMAEEMLDEARAVAAVIRDNLFGLEIDLRCTQIAAFNLALAAWRRVGYRPLPAMNLACSGLAPNATKEEWLRLAGKSEPLQRGMARLHALFKDGPVLGSLINPRADEGDLLVATFHDVRPLLEKALAQEAKDETAHEMAVTAHGLAKAAEILAGQFTLVGTNVPYLGRGKQDDVLKGYSERVYPEAKADLATCFVERCLDFCASNGSTALVTPQNWLFMGSYEMFRTALLVADQWDWILRLGEHAFDSSAAAGAFVTLVALTKRTAPKGHELVAIEAADEPTPAGKAAAALTKPVVALEQSLQLKNPDSRISFVVHDKGQRLSEFCSSFLGLGTGDYPHYGRCYWEFSKGPSDWAFQQGSVESPCLWGGREHMVAWDFDIDRVRGLSEAERAQIHNQDQSGQQAWGKWGVAVGLMRDLKPTLYTGERHEKAVAALIPASQVHLPALWTLCTSRNFHDLVRQLDQNIIVANGTLTKIPFDLAHWQQEAAEKYPDGLPKPFSSDPTQWLFNGKPKDSDQPLQVTVARLLGYEWPRKTGSSFPECKALGPDGLEKLADGDGIVCLAAIKGEPSAAERLREVLARAYGKEWNATVLEKLLAQAEFGGKPLTDWLRDGFFEQHCALFHQRPFIWHIWDGERDGFHAIVNYHRLAAPDGEGRKTLEKLTYAYLGDWITRQKAEQKQGKEGADAKVVAALHLQEELKKVLKGEPPYDLFVRWKPLQEQAIGWEPDINDGVRMNIRPFMSAETLKGKSIFRKEPKIKWDKDRGKEPERSKKNFPWFWSWDGKINDFKGGPAFDGNRWNDLHYSIEMKQAVRVGAEKTR